VLEHLDRVPPKFLLGYFPIDNINVISSIQKTSGGNEALRQLIQAGSNINEFVEEFIDYHGLTNILNLKEKRKYKVDLNGEVYYVYKK